MDPTLWQQYADLYQDSLASGGQILVIEDNPKRAEILTVCLWAINPFGVRTVTTAQALTEPLDAVDVVLVCLEVPNGDRLAAAVRILCHHPGSVLVGYGAAEGDLACREALKMARGKDSLPYPFEPAALLQTIRATRLHAMKNSTNVEVTQAVEEAASIIKSVMVFSPKGGVGTSTLAVNLAAALADAAVSTALVDADLEFGSHNVFLDLKPGRSMLWCMDERSDAITSEAVEEAMIPHAGGLRALMAPPYPELADRVGIGHLQRVIKLLRTNYRITIVDAGSGGDDRTWATLKLADVILVPIVPELPAIKLYKELLRQTAVRGLYTTRIFPVLMRASSVPSSYIAGLEAMLRRPLPWRIRSDGPAALASITSGTPFVLGSPELPLSQEVRALAACLPAEDALSRLHAGPAPAEALGVLEHAG